MTKIDTTSERTATNMHTMDTLWFVADPAKEIFLSPNNTLDETIEAFEDRDRITTEVHVEDRQKVEFTPDSIQYNGCEISLGQRGRALLYKNLGLPMPYMEAHTPEFQIAILSEDFKQAHFGKSPVLVHRNNELVTIADGELIDLPISSALRAVAAGVGEPSSGLSVTRIVRHKERIEIEIVSDIKSVAVRPGDVVKAGLHIVHDRWGREATRINTFWYRLICSNGATRRECGRGDDTRTRRLKTNTDNGFELQMEQIRRLSARHWNSLQSHLDAIKTTSERPVQAMDLLRRRLAEARISAKNLESRLFAAWQAEGSENTHYGAVNALTRVATHDRTLQPRQRRTLAALAGVMAFSFTHLCPRCLSALGGNATADDVAA